MKTCTLCKKRKNDDQFSFRNKSENRRSSWCKACYADRNKKHYHANKDAYFRNAKQWKKARKREIFNYIFAYLRDHPCVDCGETDPVVLEFDHKTDKSESIAKMVQDKRPVAAIAKEIKKCNVRCANCHRRKTAKDFSWYAVRDHNQRE